MVSDPSLMPGVAVAIACYNQAHFLSQAIGSALNQSRPADEIIVVDDGSTDNTSEVAAAYPKVRYHRQANGGLSAARNTGLAITTCDYILFLDADDTLEPETIALGLACLQANPEAAFAYGGYREIDTAGNQIFKSEANPICRSFKGLLKGNRIAMHGTVLYRTAILREVQGFDTRLPCCEDYDVYLKLSRLHPVASYAYIAANYRRHGGNMTRNTIRMLHASRTVLERQKPHVRGQPHLEKALREGRRYFEDYYGTILAQSILSGLFSPATSLPSFQLLLSGLSYNWRLLRWMARAYAQKGQT